MSVIEIKISLFRVQGHPPGSECCAHMVQDETPRQGNCLMLDHMDAGDICSVYAEGSDTCCWKRNTYKTPGEQHRTRLRTLGNCHSQDILIHD